MAAELGADILKVTYPGDPAVLSAWSCELGLPMVILGGPPSGTAHDLCALVSEVIPWAPAGSPSGAGSGSARPTRPSSCWAG